jgi:hypothetical protein
MALMCDMKQQRLCRGLLATLLIATSSTAARADEAEERRPPLRWFDQARETRETWYGWQVLLADASWMALAPTVGLSTKSVGAGVVTGISGFFILAPLVHLAHGNDKSFGSSVALRAGAPFGGAFAGLLLALSSDGGNLNDKLLGGLAVGAGIGVVAATVVDAAFMATKTTVVPTPMHAPTSSFRISPHVDVRPQQQSLGVVGTF